MADIDELVFKVNVDVVDEKLKKLRQEIKDLQQKGSQNAIKLGINTTSTGSFRENGNTKNNLTYSDEVVNSLNLSEKHLAEMLNILKKDSLRKVRITDSEERSKNLSGPIPFVNNVLDSNAGSLAGGAVGGIAGLLAGGNVIAGAQIGSAVGSIFQKIFGVVKEKIETVSNLYENQLEENLNLRQLSRQTGMSVEELYKLGKQAQFAGTSLEKVAETNQKFADQIAGGIDEKQAQLYMALGINPRTALLEAGGDPAKFAQNVFNKSDKALGNVPSALKSSYMKILNFDREDQDARHYLYRKDTTDRAQKVLNLATNNGKNPFEQSEKIHQNMLDFYGAREEKLATIRRALTTEDAAKKISTEYMQVQAKTVQLVVGAIEGLLDSNNSNKFGNIIGGKQTPGDINQGYNKYPHLGELIGGKQTPASDSATVKSTAAH